MGEKKNNMEEKNEGKYERRKNGTFGSGLMVVKEGVDLVQMGELGMGGAM